MDLAELKAGGDVIAKSSAQKNKSVVHGRGVKGDQQWIACKLPLRLLENRCSMAASASSVVPGWLVPSANDIQTAALIASGRVELLSLAVKHYNDGRRAS